MDQDERKQICEKVTEVYSQFQPLSGAESEIERLERDWSQLNPDYRNGLFTEYHKIEKNMATTQW